MLRGSDTRWLVASWCNQIASLQEVENPVGQVSLLGIEKRTNLKPSSLNIIGNEDTQWHDVVR